MVSSAIPAIAAVNICIPAFIRVLYDLRNGIVAHTDAAEFADVFHALSILVAVGWGLELVLLSIASIDAPAHLGVGLGVSVLMTVLVRPTPVIDAANATLRLFGHRTSTPHQEF